MSHGASTSHKSQVTSHKSQVTSHKSQVFGHAAARGARTVPSVDDDEHGHLGRRLQLHHEVVQRPHGHRELLEAARAVLQHVPEWAMVQRRVSEGLRPRCPGAVTSV
eukprot:376544-Prymnesium_polylepis.3